MTDPIDDALSAWAAQPEPAAAAAVLAALVDATVLLPVRATVVSEAVVATTGLRAEKESELALITLTLGDPSQDRRVLPVFTTTGAMRRWRIEARPVTASVRDACRGALDQGWQGIVVDPGGYGFPVGAVACRALADGFVPVAGDESISVGTQPLPDPMAADDPAVASLPSPTIDAVRRAIAREPAVAAAWLIDVVPSGTVAPAALHLGVSLRAPVDEAGLAVITRRVAGRLGPSGADQAITVAALGSATTDRVARTCLRLWP